MIDTNVILGIVVLATIAVVVFVAVALSRKASARRAALKNRFGPEYERAKAKYGPQVAEGILASRARRVDRYDIRELSARDRARFSSSWAVIQAQFVDDPRGAVTQAGALIGEVMRTRGYASEGGFEQRAQDLSVDHPEVVQHYRAAHALAQAPNPTPLRTEDLRQAFVHYRVIFADLLQPSSQTYPTAMMLARA